ncbi:hypothetical protein FT663_00407 [Candidozyma haemuli var. vulneris]|nr:hypothetical protein FT662_03186 [[Candida] haemuloni var. vulneris]KAF3995516.1 hypothetical protein FT663_00407 [[Candida] haemuloni var. vulneris]
MSLTTYLRSKRFRNYFVDWVVTSVAMAYFFIVAEHARPFNRQFKLNDHTIQHPFTHEERVTGHMCLFLAAFVPSVSMTVGSFIKHRKNKDQALHLLQVSLLGAALTVSLDGIITDILKNWVGRPRPDFLERCGAPSNTPTDVFVDISVCTAPLGELRLIDGMRSTPSGHSSISFSAFLFLAMWLFGQLQLSVNVASKPVYLYILSMSPLVLAAYVALSRVQDYRHHFSDIVSGMIIGCSVAVAVYRKYFHSVFAENSHEINGEEDNSGVLPL